MVQILDSISEVLIVRDFRSPQVFFRVFGVLDVAFYYSILSTIKVLISCRSSTYYRSSYHV